MNDWQRVSRANPCPVCGRPDWCLFAGPADNPAAAICARVESAKRCGEAGWLHVLRDERGPTWAPWRRSIRRAGATAGAMSAAPAADLAAEAAAGVAWAGEHPAALDALANGLGITAGSLRRLGVGYSPDRRAWLFPMRTPAGEICGVRLRLPAGRKLAIRGGREGLFLPDGDGIDAGGRLVVCEGPTDAAAMLDLGLPAVGRPSCRGGVPLLVELVGRLKTRQVVVFSDADAPGRQGAADLAARLVALCGDVRTVAPPAGAKDARAWKRAGATAADVEALIAAAEPRRLTIETRTRKGRAWTATATA